MNIIYICKYLGRMLIIKLMWCLSEKHPLVVFPFCAFLSWFNVVSHLVDFISRSDVTPFHSVKQYVSTGFELTAFRLCKASYFCSKGTYIFCTRCTALSCCSDELLVTVRSTAQRQSTFTDELLLKKTFISFLCFSVTCVIRSRVDQLTSLIGSF